MYHFLVVFFFADLFSSIARVREITSKELNYDYFYDNCIFRRFAVIKRTFIDVNKWLKGHYALCQKQLVVHSDGHTLLQVESTKQIIGLYK